MFIKNYLFLVKIIFLFPILLIFLIFRIFLNIRIGMIETSSFGHMLIPIEIFLCEKKDKKLENTDLVLWFCENPAKLDMRVKTLNTYILEKWRKNLLILPRHLLEPLFILFYKFKSTRKFVYIVKEKNPIGKVSFLPGKKIDEYNLLKKYEPFIKFSKKEENLATEILTKYNLNKNDRIVCFAGRSQFYKNEKLSARNSNVLNQIDGMKFLIDNGYKAVRLGKDEEVQLPQIHDNLIDFSFSKDRSDFLDLYLVSICEFFVSPASGINEMATIMRKKKLLIDFSHFENLYKQNLSFIPIILPKKIFSKKQNKIIPYSKFFEFKFEQINNLNKFEEGGYQLIDNTSDEIRYAINNMSRLVKNKINFEQKKIRQQKFWENFEKFYAFSPKNTIICPTFFDNNEDYLIS